MMSRFFLCLLLPFLFLSLDHVDSRHSRQASGKSLSRQNFDLGNKVLESSGGHQVGTLVADKRKRKGKQVLSSKQQRKDEKKKTKKKNPGHRPKTESNRRTSKRHCKGTGQKKKRQQKKKKKSKQKKEQKRENSKKHNRSCSVESSCIVNAQTVLLFEKNQVIHNSLRVVF